MSNNLIGTALLVATLSVVATMSESMPKWWQDIYSSLDYFPVVTEADGCELSKKLSSCLYTTETLFGSVNMTLTNLRIHSSDGSRPVVSAGSVYRKDGTHDVSAITGRLFLTETFTSSGGERFNVTWEVDATEHLLSPVKVGEFLTYSTITIDSSFGKHVVQSKQSTIMAGPASALSVHEAPHFRSAKDPDEQIEYVLELSLYVSHGYFYFGVAGINFEASWNSPNGLRREMASGSKDIARLWYIRS
ncbi:hypothetical protein FOL47_006031 [Perkinsus chesapeaki]|uniref:Uncharacterized protein n=1 Tax=Perkinsus chesapeaki TaxID=330153 RepID=A0A7J6LUB7_PERCH|nr:hypothetical protein FOL47_006031 [Perkinsus chesapeaki]